MAGKEAAVGNAYCEELFDVLDELTYTAYSFRITDKIVEIRFVTPYSPAVFSFYTKAIQHLATPAEPEDLVIWVAERTSSGLCLPRPFWNWDHIAWRGRILDFDEEKYYANYDLASYTFTLFERTRKRAVVWTQDVFQQPEWTRSFPFRMLWFEWLKAYGFLLVHAGAVALPEGHGVLLAGRGGAGKSTSTLACLDSSLLYAGDDFVAVHPASGRVYSLYNVAKLEEHQFIRFPHLRPLVYNQETMHQEKGQVFVADHFPEKLTTGFQLESVLLPRFVGSVNTTLRPATAADGWRALVPSTVELLYASDEYARAIAACLRRFPIYWLDTGTDLSQIPRCIHELLKSKC